MTIVARARQLRRALESLIGIPATEGNDITVLRNGDAIFPAMLDAIDAATATVDLVTFVYWRGDIARRFAEHLASAARRGVRVRVLLDAVGARLIKEDLVDLMTDAGVDLRWFRPVTDGAIGEVTHRTHRKILLVDESIGFTGGVGIADEWTGDARHEGEWRDTHFRVVGPAVDGLRAAFVDNWLETADHLEIDPLDRFPDHRQAGASVVLALKATAAVAHNDITTLFEALLALAEEQILITTAYFTPDDRMQDALIAAVRRGVRVEVLVPGPHADKRFVQVAGESVYERLLGAGVVIDCFQPSMLHAKVLTVDKALAVVGSANVNNRSLVDDDEVALVILDPEIVARLDGDRAGDVSRSERLDLDRWRRRSVAQRLQESFTGIIQERL